MSEQGFEHRGTCVATVRTTFGGVPIKCGELITDIPYRARGGWYCPKHREESKCKVCGVYVDPAHDRLCACPPKVSVCFECGKPAEWEALGLVWCNPSCLATQFARRGAEVERALASHWTHMPGRCSMTERMIGEDTDKRRTLNCTPSDLDRALEILRDMRRTHVV